MISALNYYNLNILWAFLFSLISLFILKNKKQARFYFFISVVMILLMAIAYLFYGKYSLDEVTDNYIDIWYLETVIGVNFSLGGFFGTVSVLDKINYIFIFSFTTSILFAKSILIVFTVYSGNKKNYFRDIKKAFYSIGNRDIITIICFIIIVVTLQMLWKQGIEGAPEYNIDKSIAINLWEILSVFSFIIFLPLYLTLLVNKKQKREAYLLLLFLFVPTGTIYIYTIFFINDYMPNISFSVVISLLIYMYSVYRLPKDENFYLKIMILPYLAYYILYLLINLYRYF